MMGVCMKCGRVHPQGSICEPLALQPIASLAPVMGCICPPGANLTCENPMCPRKPPQPMRAVGTA